MSIVTEKNADILGDQTDALIKDISALVQGKSLAAGICALSYLATFYASAYPEHAKESAAVWNESALAGAEDGKAAASKVGFTVCPTHSGSSAVN